MSAENIEETMGVTVNGASGVPFEPDIAADPELDRLWIEDSIVICATGGCAEARSLDMMADVWGWQNDFTRASQLAGRIVASFDEEEGLLAWLWIRADNIVHEPGTWQAVCDLAAALLDRGKLTGKAAEAVIKASLSNRPSEGYLDRVYFSATLPLPLPGASGKAAEGILSKARKRRRPSQPL